jgi:hypothetical protein
MLVESIGGYAKQLKEIQARQITSIELQSSMEEEQEEELTGVESTAVDQRRASRENGDLPKQCTGEEEERRRR